MMKLGFTFSLVLSINIAIAQNGQIKGRVIGQDLQNVNGAQIIDLKTGKQAKTDASGFYYIEASIGDTLRFSYIGYTAEKRTFIDTSGNLNILLINRDTNDLGSPLTKRQWKKAKKETDQFYKKLEIEAAKSGKWNYVWITDINGLRGLDN